ncbi:MAG: trypsin-like peptidase domain-containing protein [Candidatus Contendobacter sp.]|nr:trypsin-like peptidase domain-containing protein [Candidatus Contendobacter sp.]
MYRFFLSSFILFWSSLVNAQDFSNKQITRPELSASAIYKLVSPGVVVIRTMGNGNGMQGSGVVISRQKVITNCHVLKNSNSISVEKSSVKYKAIIEFSDIDGDLCSLHVPGLPITPVNIGSSRALSIGDTVYALGAPQGLDLTLSNGLLSAKRRIESGEILQITAPISPGSSGGGLFNSSGELVGITTLYLKDSQQLNFALPVEWIRDLPKRHKKDNQYFSPPKVTAEEGILLLNELGKKYSSQDPDGFKRRYPDLMKRVAEVKSKYPPEKWVSEVDRFYSSLIKRDEVDIERGREQLNQLDLELEKSDPDYIKLRPQLVESISSIAKDFPPSQWAAEARKEYARIKMSSGQINSGSGWVGVKANSKSLFYDRLVLACKTMVLNSKELTRNVILADAGSVDELCGCAASLTASSMTDNEMSAAITTAPDADSAVMVMAKNFTVCVQSSP